MTLGPEADVSHLRQLSAENFQVVLRRIPGNKDLILKPDLMKPLDKFADMSLIKRCGVDRVFKIEQKGPPEASTAATKVSTFQYQSKYLYSRILLECSQI